MTFEKILPDFTNYSWIQKKDPGFKKSCDLKNSEFQNLSPYFKKYSWILKMFLVSKIIHEFEQCSEFKKCSHFLEMFCISKTVLEFENNIHNFQKYSWI